MVVSSRSGMPVRPSAARMSSTVLELTVVAARKSAPPSNSMPGSSPRIPSAPREMSSRTAEMAYQRRRRAMKS